MKKILLLLALSLCLLSPLSLHADEDDSPLEGQMKILARGMRQLTQQAGDPSKQQENVSLLETLKKAANDAKGLIPRRTAAIAQNDREKFLADYRTDLDELKDTLNQVEESVKAGSYDKVKSLLATVNTIKKEGHGKFKAD